VVPLIGQLREEAQREATLVRGLHTTHTGILEDERAIAAIRGEIDRCR
jgi:hypothetical protein